MDRVWDVNGSAKDRFILMLVERVQALERVVWQLEGSATDTYSVVFQANGYIKLNEMVAVIACGLNHPDIAEVRFNRAKRFPILELLSSMMADILPLELDVVVRFKERMLFDAAAYKLATYTSTFEGVARTLGEWRRMPNAAAEKDGSFVYKPTCRAAITDRVAAGTHSQNPLGARGPWIF
jgi:hypothetical protein